MNLKIGKESVVVRGIRPEESGWGPYQFPTPYAAGDKIAVSPSNRDTDSRFAPTVKNICIYD